MLNKIFAISFALLLFVSVKADEGMWIPMLLKQLNESDMQAKGLKLSAEDIYSINKSSLKDAIVHFNGGCTGEIISNQGLLITNHHCGYGAIQSHSSVKNDYLTDGFWAKTQKEELPNEGLYVTFIVRMEDVTKVILEGVKAEMAQRDKDKKIKENIEKHKELTTKGTLYDAIIKPFYFGNQYYMFVTETFDDIRLVGAPPSSIGKFGGDTDNWMWPRHTGDFSIFRIYADKNNKPAKYSADNVPYQPKHHLPINIKDLKKDDFTMVYGFPGRTQEYLTSYAVDYVMNKSNPAKIKFRAKSLEILDFEMKRSDEVRIKYAAKYAHISNYHKKWIGENRGLKKLDAINKKKAFEAKFMEAVNASPPHKGKYGNLLPDFEKLYQEQEKYAFTRDLYLEFVYYSGADMVNFANKIRPVVGQLLSNSKNAVKVQQELQTLDLKTRNYFKNLHIPTDKKMFATLLQEYYENADKDLNKGVFDVLEKKFKMNYQKYTDYIYSKTFLTNQEKMTDYIKNMDESIAKKIKADPGYHLLDAMAENYYLNIFPEYRKIGKQIEELMQDYVQGMQVLLPKEKKYYPDANSTLRLTYGKIEGYEPMDGVVYDYFSTIDGIMEKHDPDNVDFTLPKKLITLYENKDYGRYSTNGTVRVCFTASNHTTGGNSGSPVLNAEGHLIGVNFDRSWESTMSDIMFDPERCRNIVVDMHYVLFIIDKYAGATRLTAEMTIIE